MSERLRKPERRVPGRPLHRQTSSGVVPTNRLFGLLPKPAAAQLAPHLEPVHLERKEVLFRAHEPLRVVYFPNTAVVSLVARLRSGEALEVGLVGLDGLAGTALFPGITRMPYDGIVQIPGVAQRVSADVLRDALLTNESLHTVIGRFSQLMLVRSMQLSICNLFHTVEQRCIRWLLTVRDVVSDDEIPLTHELLATMLGVHRPTVTLVVRALHRAGLVDESRGEILIRDRPGLEAACCECYRVMRQEQRRLLGY